MSLERAIELFGGTAADWRRHPNGGGWIYKDATVHNTAYIGPEAIIADNALVCDNAIVCGNARVCGNAQVYGNAWVYGDAQVYDRARVYGYARVYGNALVYNNTKIYGYTLVFNNIQVYNNNKPNIEPHKYDELLKKLEGMLEVSYNEDIQEMYEHLRFYKMNGIEINMELFEKNLSSLKNNP